VRYVCWRFIKYLIFGVWLLLILCPHIYAQDIHSKYFLSTDLGTQLFLDSLSVDEKSIQIYSSNGINYSFSYHLSTGNLTIFPANLDVTDSILVKYQTLPFALHQSHTRRRLDFIYDSTALFKNNIKLPNPKLKIKEEVFSDSGLQKTGALTRGISFGNSQNVFLNSQLNLQLSGQLTKNLKIRAAITDQSIPYQADGNSQSIQNLDHVLIELYNDQTSWKTGDINIQENQSEFLTYYKNIQGTQWTKVAKPKGKLQSVSKVIASLAKGKFASTLLTTQEGIMGPYRIYNSQRQNHLVILANSEKVFLDGRLLKRGFNFDYIMDYNSGEITFTPQVLITRYSRVNVDYEFSERSFTRTILAASQSIVSKNSEFFVNFYNEFDNKFKPILFDLSKEQIEQLAALDGNISVANLVRVDSVAFDPYKVLYKKSYFVDVKGNSQQYFEYSTDPNVAFFIPYFKEVGKNEGDYIRNSQSINGIIYEFVPRVNGLSQGNFEISVPISLPDKKQMVTAGTKITLNSFEKVYAEIAFSNHDSNLFSAKSSQSQKGFALKAGFSSQERKISVLKDYRFNGFSEIEFTGAHFNFIDRKRPIEFDRDWGLNAQNNKLNENDILLSSRMEIVKDQENLFRYYFQFRLRDDVLHGIQQQVTWKEALGKRINFNQEFFRLKTVFQESNAEWIRYSGETRFRYVNLESGYKFSLDRNQILQKETMNIIGSAMSFSAHDFFLRSINNSKFGFFMDLNLRSDKAPNDGRMISDSKAYTLRIGAVRTVGNHKFKADYTFRELAHLKLNKQRETTLLGKLEYQGSLFKNAFQHELSYAIGNGREFKRGFYFLLVPNGEGTHTWRDDNSDAVQQIEEFYLALNPEEKNYIKILVPTADFVNAYQSIFNYRLNLRFPELSEPTASLFLKTLLKISFTGLINIDKKTDDTEVFNRINPFYQSENKISLISWKESKRGTLFYNRNSAKFGLDLNYINTSSQQLLVLGSERYEHREWKLNTRMSVGSNFNIKTSLLSGLKSSELEFIKQRDFEIRSNTYGTEFTWLYSKHFRSTLGVQKSYRVNLGVLDKIERSIADQFSIEMRYSKAIKTTINSQFKFTNIEYNGELNSSSGYEMLQALQVGNNFSFNIQLTQKIGEGLQIQTVYDGRSINTSQRWIHVGRVQAVALF
jgi:hypothetical protein